MRHQITVPHIWSNMGKYKVVETFVSINGEATHAGELACFIRFAGCNLACGYCDTKWANEPQVPYKSMSAEEIYAYIKSCGVKNVTLTGGEPLIQPEIEWLITLLSADKALRVEIETNGSVDIAGYDARPENVCMTLDYKLPDSGMEQFMRTENYAWLKPQDAVKFVVSSTSYRCTNTSGIRRKKEYKMAIDKEAIKEHIRGILVALGDDPDREGLKETPDRVARMYEEVFEGMNYTNDEIAEMFNKSFERPGKDTSDMVLVKDIEVFSYCEHHMALMYDMHVSVAYIPKGKVLGLSKIARIADMVAKRLQLQERIGTDIAYIMSKVTGSEDVAVVIEGSHSCMTARGIRNASAKTFTTTFTGEFEKNETLQNKLMMLLK